MTYLQLLLAEAMDLPWDDPRVAKAIQTLRKAKVVDEAAIKREEIRRDPCREPKEVCRKHHVSRATVYRAWGS